MMARCLRVTHVSGHRMAFKDTARIGAHTDGARFALEVGTVGSGASAESVPANDSLESLSFADTVDGYHAFRRQNRHRDGLPGLETLEGLDAEFLLQLKPRVLGPLASLPGLGTDSEDNGIIAILFLGFGANDGVGLYLQIRHGNGLSGREKRAGHADFFGNHTNHI